MENVLHLLHDTSREAGALLCCSTAEHGTRPNNRAVQEVAKGIGLDLMSFYTAGMQTTRQLQRDPRVWCGCPADRVLSDFRK
jgi:hypothetical protein